MAKSKISKTAAKVFSDLLYETLKQCRTPEQREVLINLNDNIIRRRYKEEDISYESCDTMINCFDRERAEA